MHNCDGCHLQYRILNVQYGLKYHVLFFQQIWFFKNHIFSKWEFHLLQNQFCVGNVDMKISRTKGSLEILYLPAIDATYFVCYEEDDDLNVCREATL